jgi:uncharacterized membrane protein (DUF4010 family)
MEIYSQIPKDLVNFLLVVVFSLLIGVEQRRLHIDKSGETLFGTDRTLTLIGILGFILYILMPQNFGLYIAGGVAITIYLVIYYYNKIKIQNQWGFTSIITALITYTLAPLIYLEPHWIVMLIVVTVLIIVEIKENLFTFSQNIDKNEFITLAKFIIIAGIILPLLPVTPFSQNINISPYQIWLSIVAVSSISYISYILRKFIFPNSGILLSAILGGLYSSTATTIVLAKTSKEDGNTIDIITGIIAATGMMYLRILFLAFIFNKEIASKLSFYFIPLFLISFLFIAVMRYLNKTSITSTSSISQESISRNPLEFKTALVFGLLFGFFSILTGYVVTNYGNIGVNILSFIVGVTDIDPYILNLFQNSVKNLQIETIIKATIIASASNNLLKLIYSLVLGNKKIYNKLITTFSILIVISIVLSIL